MREFFRRAVVKSWLALPLERLKSIVCNKIIVREAVKFYSECWRERCKVLHTPEHKKSRLRDEIKQMKIQAAKGDKVNFETHVNLHPMNENETSIHKIKSWVTKARMFRANAKNAAQQDIRKFGNIR